MMLTFRARKAAGPWVLRAGPSAFRAGPWVRRAGPWVRRAGPWVCRAALTVFLALAAGCSREQQDWRSAEAADTVESYGQFLSRHPDSELATQARTRVTQLAEEREWQQASSADTADAYRQFLAQHPNGKWAQEARIRIQNFALNGLPPAGPPMAATPETAPVTSAPGAVPPASGATAIAAPGELAHAAGSAEIAAPAGPRAPSAAAPAPINPTPAPVSPQPPKYGTPYVATTAGVTPNISSTNGQPAGYGIQLGAFGSQSAASNAWQQLTARFGAQLRGLTPIVVAANTANGPLFRLRAQVADEAQARSLCDMLRKQSQACVPVLPHGD
jgi:SPOR domain